MLLNGVVKNLTWENCLISVFGEDAGFSFLVEHQNGEVYGSCPFEPVQSIESAVDTAKIAAEGLNSEI